MKRTLLAAALLAAMTAYAQPKPPPAWHQGKPPAMADSKLAPLPGRMTETPASEIPIGKLKLPMGRTRPRLGHLRGEHCPRRPATRPCRSAPCAGAARGSRR